MSHNADSRAVARNAATSYVAWSVHLILGLLATPILLSQLSEDGFAAWTLVLTLSGYVGLVELGLGNATIRRIAAALANDDADEVRVVLASTRATYLVVAAVAFVFVAVLASLPGTLIKGTGLPAAQVRTAVIILGVALIIGLAMNVWPSLAIGAGRSDLTIRTGMVFRVIQVASQIVSVLIVDDLLVLSTVTAATSVGGSLAVRSVARRRFPDLPVRIRFARRDVARQLIASGWRNAVIGIAATFAIYSDTVIVGSMLSAAAVAAYGVAARAGSLISTLANRAADVLVPTQAHHKTTGDTARALVLFRESLLVTWALLLPALLVMASLAEPLLRIWLRTSPPEGSGAVLIVLVLGMVVAAPGHVSFVLLTGVDRLQLMMWGGIVAAIANVALSIWLATTPIGMLGPAVGSLVVFMVWDGLLLPRHAARVLGVATRDLTSGHGRALGPPVVAAGLVSLLVARLQPTGWGAVMGTIAIGGTFVLTVSVSVGAERRSRYLKLLRRNSVRGSN